MFTGTRLLAMDDDLRMKATECIQTNFLDVLETREFHILPTIKLELIGERNRVLIWWDMKNLDSTILKPKLMCDLVINWIAEQLRKDNDLQELCEYVWKFTRKSLFELEVLILDAFTLSQRWKTSWLCWYGW